MGVICIKKHLYSPKYVYEALKNEKLTRNFPIVLRCSRFYLREFQRPPPHGLGCSKQTSKICTFFAYSFTSFDNQIRGKVDISPFFDMAMSTCLQTFFEIEINSSGFISKIMTQRHHEYDRRNSSKLVIRLPCFGNSKCRPYGIRTCVMRLFLIHEGDFAI